MKLTVHHAINCTPEAFWELYLDPDFTRRLHLEGLGSTSVEVLSQETDADGIVRRRLRYGQRPDAPGPVRKLFGDEVVTTEDGTFDPARGLWSFTLIPGTLADKTNLHGTMRLREASGGASDQEFTLEAKVKMLGVGGIVEKFIERQARDSQAKAAAYVNQQLAAS
jgi:uncharacterized protein DUF2505